MEDAWAIWQIGYVSLLWRCLMERFSYPSKSCIMWFKGLLWDGKVKTVISQDEKNDNIVWWLTLVVNYLRICIFFSYFISLSKLGKYKILLQLFFVISNDNKWIIVCIFSKILCYCIYLSLSWSYTHKFMDSSNIIVTNTIIIKHFLLY